MHILYNSDHARHRSPYEILNGERDTHQEVPERAETILQQLRTEAAFTVEENTQLLPESLLRQVHAKAYVTFLREFCETLAADEYRYPSVFPVKATSSVPTNRLAQQGFYSFDMYTPLSRTTYSVAINSASLAWRAAVMISNNPSEPVYALCRPPGHHAEPAQMGGYCYFNNAAVAAEYLSKVGRVAVLDVDFHHGNGTQHIFYERADVLTVSIHADPDWKFPHMCGFEDELGSGRGSGYNLNICAQQGVTNEEYSQLLHRACAAISEFRADFLVVSFGADTFAGDPIGGFALSSDYFIEMGQIIANLQIPTITVQEGGYNTAELGINVHNFLIGIDTSSTPMKERNTYV